MSHARYVRFPSVGLALAVLFGVSATLGCNKRDSTSIGTAGNPVVLVVSPTHGPSGHKAAPETFAQLGQALTSGAGFTVEVRAAANPVAAIEAFGNGQGDLGLLTLMEFLLARQEYGVEARLQVLRGGAASYTAQVLVKEDSPITAVEGLRGKTLAFVDAFSVSGYLLPATLLTGLDVRAEFTGSHEASLDALRAGRVDAAATYGGEPTRTVGLRALATTRAVPNEPVFVRKGLDVQKANAVVAALEKLATTPQGNEALHQWGGVDGFRPTTDEAYADARTMLRDVGRRLEEAVPGGRSIVVSNVPSALQSLRD